MKKTTMFEEMESRRLLSASVTATIGATSGNTASAATAPLTVGPNTLFFNAVTSSNTSQKNIDNGSSSGGSHTSTYQLRVQNTGTKRISVTSIRIRGTDQGDFTINFPTAGQSFGIGKQINYNVTFTADSTVGLKSAFLIINTSNASYTNIRVPIRAMVTKGEGTTFEPSLQDVFNLYGFQINAGEVANTSNPYFVASGTSDEVDISTLVKADASKDVVLRPLAEFTNHATPDVRMGFYTPGDLDSEKYLWYSPSESSQSVTPLVYGQTTFDPGNSPFGLVTQYPFFTNPDGTTTNVYSENALNKKMYTSSTNTSLVHMKFYPYKDANGNLVANTYIVAEEEFGSDSVSDSQDLIFIVTNVKPADAKPTVAVQNLTGYPSNDIASFNVVQTDDAFVPNITRTSNTFRIFNTGTQPLIATFALAGTDAADYSITQGGGTGVTIAAGGFRDVKVNFNATSGTAVHTASLVITSNDAANPTKTVGLLGNWQQFSEQQGQGFPSVEPSAQKLVNNLLGYQTNVLNSGQSFEGVGSLVSYVGDEIHSEYFQAADSDAPVNVTQLATFHNQTFLNTTTNMQQATTSFIGWYKQGSPNSSVQNLGPDVAGQGQMILGNQSNGTVYHGKFKPAGEQVFGIVVEHQNSTDKVGEYSDHTLNIEPAGDNSTAMAKFGGLFLRFFPAFDEHGVRIPNAYIMLHDYNKTTTNYDFQDNIYLITNIMPAGGMKTPRTVYAQKTSAGNLINFTSPDDGPKVFGFNVYRSTSPSSGFTKLNSTLLPRRPSGSFTDTTAVAGTTYYYQVTTVGNGGVESDPYTVIVDG